MKTGYRVENSPATSKYHKTILVSNYDSINMVVNLPCTEDSCLLFKSGSNVGFWKLKQREQ